MSYTDADVERVAEAIYKADPCFYTYNAGDWEPSDFYSDDLEEHWREVARKQARAALEAMAREPLEDVLRAQHVYNIQIEPAGPNYYAEVVSAAHDRRTGTGATIDDAIRAAVAAADEER